MSAPSHPDETLLQTLRALESVVDFAYDHGYREHGIPLVEAVREHLRAQAADKNTAEESRGVSVTAKGVLYVLILIVMGALVYCAATIQVPGPI